MDQNKYQLDTDDNRLFLKQIREELLSFGQRFPSPSGASYYLGDDGSPWKERPRETWITCRMAHVYSMGALLGCQGSKELAEKAVCGICSELKDREHGGWYPGITDKGEILPGKQCYAHAFVILAASSACLAGITGAEELLRESLEIYERYFWDEQEGLALDCWDTDFRTADKYRGLNANMHTVEAFLAAADTLDILGDQEKNTTLRTESYLYRQRAGRIISRVLIWAEENEWRIPEHYTGKWIPDLECSREKPDDPFKPYGATPGHGIEWARLILQWAASLSLDQDKLPAAVQEAAKNLYVRAVSDAWNCDGAPGIVYTTDWNGQPVVHDRMHWTLAEAINTSSVLYRVLKEQSFADDYAAYMEYLDLYVLDHEKGSWFHQLDRNNHVTGTVWPGKSDLYHAFQSTLIPYNQRIGLSIAPSLMD